MKLNRILLLIAVVFAFSACETMDDPEQTFSSTYPISGQWWVKLDVETGPNEWSEVVGYSKLLTFNTASNSMDTIWISDLDPSNGFAASLWDFQVKCPIDLTDNSFGMQDSAINIVEDYNIKIKVYDGFVSLGDATSISGVETDSINFKIVFEDDPGSVYRISGHRRTGFVEDDPE